MAGNAMQGASCRDRALHTETSHTKSLRSFFTMTLSSKIILPSMNRSACCAEFKQQILEKAQISTSKINPATPTATTHAAVLDSTPSELPLEIRSQLIRARSAEAAGDTGGALGRSIAQR